MQTIISFIVWLVPYYLAVNLFVLAFIVYTRLAANAIKNWPSVRGTVLSSTVAHSFTKNGTALTDPFPYITYTYDVRGKTFKSYNFRPGGDLWPDEAAVKAVVAHYPKGAEVNVFYNPKNPSKSFLEKGGAGGQSRRSRNLSGWPRMAAAKLKDRAQNAPAVERKHREEVDPGQQSVQDRDILVQRGERRGRMRSDRQRAEDAGQGQVHGRPGDGKRKLPVEIQRLVWRVGHASKDIQSETTGRVFIPACDGQMA